MIDIVLGLVRLSLPFITPRVSLGASRVSRAYLKSELSVLLVVMVEVCIVY